MITQELYHLYKPCSYERNCQHSVTRICQIDVKMTITSSELKKI